MRPRLLHRGNSPPARRPGSPLPGFNEAAATSPRKQAAFQPSQSWLPSGFNEAAATSPRKHWLPSSPTAAERSFNEAAATSPRKPGGEMQQLRGLAALQ